MSPEEPIVQPPDILPQQARENPEPQENTNPVPWTMIALTGMLLAFGAFYIAMSDIDQPGSWGDARDAAELAGPAAGGAAKVDGAALYAAMCVACHQANGQGLPGVFPPLAGSEWVVGDEGTPAAILLHGATGPLTVKGTTYNGAMPAFKDQLSDEQIAAVLSFVRSQWGNAGTPVTADTVAKVRDGTRERSTPFAGDKELKPKG